MKQFSWTKTAIGPLVAAVVYLIHAPDVDAGGTGDLIVRITDIGSDSGRIAIALYDSRASYKIRENSFRDDRLPISNREAVWRVSDIPFARYAVMLYHDENGNGEFDTNLFGFPLENYGFSNNAGAFLGPPAYDKAAFHLAEDEQEHVIRLNGRSD